MLFKVLFKYFKGNIPTGGDEGEEETESQTSSRTGGEANVSTPVGGSAQSNEEALAFLRSQPQFAQMRQLLQQNPSLLAPLLQQLAQSNPQLLQVSHLITIEKHFNYLKRCKFL